MTRAALLPTGADPFLLAYWLRHYRTWAADVDELHVGVCGPVAEEAYNYIASQIAAAPNASFIHLPERTPHGLVLAELLGRTSADHVMFIEDDAYIRIPDVVRQSFEALETGETDLIGCPRDGYATEQLISVARRKFGDEPRGLAFWPTFLFVAREHLEATDKRFEGTTWQAGEQFLDSVLEVGGSADTMVWASYQLRDLGLRVTLKDAYHVGEDIPKSAPWFHVGSLSQGHGYLWQRPIKPLTDEQRQAEVGFWSRLPWGEAAKRVSWWLRAWERHDGGIPQYHDEYGEGLQGVIRDFNVPAVDIQMLMAHLDYLPTWPQ